MTKFLIIRFSSIGDIVLTSPVVRCLKEQFKGELEIHFLTKPNFKELVEANPFIDHVHFLRESTKETIDNLKQENFDFIIDLHHNLRTLRVKKALNVKSYSFTKLNVEKWVLVNFKKNKLPEKHIVDRYLETVKDFDIENDGKGLDFHFHPEYKESEKIKELPENFIAFVIGAKFNTKRLPENKIHEICSSLDSPVVLLGGPEEKEEGNRIAQQFKHVESLCGEISLTDSAKVLQQSKVVICNDTGLMHIASAFDCKIVSIWGNTVPDFGMYPYSKDQNYSIHQVPNLNCRPCSKIGFKDCPKKHFNCMQQQNIAEIEKQIKDFI